jgi:glutathione peroxidase
MNIYDIKLKKIDGTEGDLKAFQNKVLLAVNVASRCGFTPQYAELESLYKKFKNQGFEVLAFPCNQFGHQEPGSEKEIQQFCETNYQVSFPLFSKIEVNGTNTHPLYVYLKKEAKGLFGSESIKWNFTKFLINRQGKVVKRFGPMEKPLSLEKEILQLL